MIVPSQSCKSLPLRVRRRFPVLNSAVKRKKIPISENGRALHLNNHTVSLLTLERPERQGWLAEQQKSHSDWVGILDVDDDESRSSLFSDLRNPRGPIGRRHGLPSCRRPPPTAQEHLSRVGQHLAECSGNEERENHQPSIHENSSQSA